MDQTEFLTYTAWLQGDTDDTSIVAARTALGPLVGGDAGTWHSGIGSETYYVNLFNSLNEIVTLSGRRGTESAVLLNELATMSTSDERTAWLNEVVRELEWSSLYGPPGYDENYAMTYRYVKATQAYEWEDATTGEWLDQSTVDAMDQSEADTESAGEDATVSPDERYTMPEWDANWGMFYQYDNVEEVYRYAYSVEGPDVTWYSYDEAMRLSTEPESEPEPEPAQSAPVESATSAIAPETPPEPPVEQAKDEIAAETVKTLDSVMQRVLADPSNDYQTLPAEDLLRIRNQILQEFGGELVSAG